MIEALAGLLGGQGGEHCNGLGSEAEYLDDVSVVAVVVIDAFIPDVNQRLIDLTAGSTSCLDPNSAFNAVPFSGGVDLYLRTEANPPYTGFNECFANGVGPREAAVLAAVQRPAALDQLFEPSGPPAWETIPSWSLIGTEDHVVPPALRRPCPPTPVLTSPPSTPAICHSSLVLTP